MSEKLSKEQQRATPIEELDPSVRVLNILKRHGFRTVGDILDVEDALFGILFSTCPRLTDLDACADFCMGVIQRAG